MSGIGFRRNGRHDLSDAGDWREAIWNRWLVSYLTPKAEEADRKGPYQAGPEQAETAPEPTPNVADAKAPAAPDTPQAATPHESRPDSSFPGRSSARARLDALLEQVYSLEGTIDTLVQRSQRTTAQERLEVRRITEALDRVGELQERHTDALLSCTRALERFERRMMSLERHAMSRPLGDPRPPLGTFHSEPPRGLEPEFREPLTPSGRPRAPLSGTRPATDSSQGFQGNLGDLSVPTLLSMFELEHRTGTFDIETEEHSLSIQLEIGKLVSVVHNGLEADAVDALCSVIDSRHGRFTFTPIQRASTPSGRTVSVGSVLLRVSQKSDEDKRLLYAT